MKWKVCGMKNPDNIRALAPLEPNYMGFIFWEHSARHLQQPIPKLVEGIQKVGVFVNASLQTVESTVASHHLQLVQLHGNETPEFCHQLQKQGIKVIKAFAVGTTFDFEILLPYESACDYYLFDTKGKNPGGNGTQFDWEVLKKYPSKKPFFLSGGIGLEDLSKIKAIEGLPIHAIDVNSKFELEPGLKNIEKLNELKLQL